MHLTRTDLIIDGHKPEKIVKRNSEILMRLQRSNDYTKAKLGGCFPRGDTAHGNDKSQTRKCNVNLSKFDHVKGESSA